MFGLTQIIKSATHITYSSTSLIDHILASLPESVSQEVVINIGYQTTNSCIALGKWNWRCKTGGFIKKIFPFT